jgi:hypothetical protein
VYTSRLIPAVRERPGGGRAAADRTTAAYCA